MEKKLIRVLIDRKLVSILAVEKVLITSETVDKQENAVKESQGIFAEIVSAIDELTKEVKQIASGLNYINHMKDDVVSKVENLSAILEETAAGTEEVTASAEEVTASTDQFVNNFNNLKDMAKELKEKINKFRL